MVGEEQTNGKTVEEWIYDKNGNLKEAFTYNTLDSSSKFYTRQPIYNANGEHIGDFDQTGEHKTEVEYVDKTTLVKTQKTAGGTTFAYGYDLADRVTSISQSTEGGEENSTQRVYQNGLLTKLISGNTLIEYEYEEKRRISTIKVNGVVEKTYTYSADDETITLTDKDGITWVTVKDDFGNVTSITKNGVEIERNTYTNGLLTESLRNGVTTSYEYDSEQRITKKTVDSETTTYTYDNYGNVTSETTGADVVSYTYSEDSSKTLKTATKGGFTTHFKTDVNGRNVSKMVYDSSNFKFMGEEIAYLKKGDHATNLPVSIKYLDKFNQCPKDNLKYSYDARGNICQINENGKLLSKYTYDGLNRLIREDNAKLGKTYLFDYDQTGNITSRLECPFTLDNADSITAFDKAETLIYDGDRLIRTGSSDKSYYNANGKLTTYLGFSISFKEGGLISSYRSFNYEYDALGRRTKKGAITYTYSKNGLLTSQSDGISFIYDHSNQMIGIKKDYSTYYFRKNLQGDVIALLDIDGYVVVKYYYDAWGNHKIYNASGVEITDTTHIGHLNPIRYRGYYYDTEFGFYYLKSRYYDPQVGRFISQDNVDYADYEAINGLNLYAYCNNNPVMYSDPTGHLPNWAKWLIGGVAFIGAVALTVVSGGSLAPVFIGMGISIASSALIEGGISAYNGEGFWSGFADGAADGAMWGGIFSLASAGIGAIKYTRGFRVVGLDEYDDIVRSGKFASKGFSEGKYFWSSKSSARAFVSKMGMADDTYRIIGSRISRPGLKKALSKGTAYYFSYLDDIGRAYFIDIDIVNQLVSKIWTVF